MNNLERQELYSLPPKYRPLGAWAFWGYSLLFALPVIGIICLIIFSFSDANICRRNFARSFFCVYALVLIITAILIFTGLVGVITAFIASLV